MKLILLMLFAFTVECTLSHAATISENASALLIEKINQERAVNHLPLLSASAELNQMAFEWATVLASSKKLKHRSRGFLIDQLKKNSWKRMNENLHASPEASDPEAVVRSWMKSRVHRRNCLDPEITLAGAGFVLGDDGKVYVVFNGAAVFAKAQ